MQISNLFFVGALLAAIAPARAQQGVQPRERSTALVKRESARSATAAAVAKNEHSGLPLRDRRASMLAFIHVSLVDVERGRILPNQTVLITGNRIRAVAPSDQVRIPSGARVVNGSGKYLIPGLWDMHAHITDLGPMALKLNLANGVTGVRDMGARRFATAKAWRDSIAAGRLLGPRMKIASPIVERPEWLMVVRKWYADAGAPAEILEERFGPSTPAEAVRWVDSVVALGADHIKVRNWPAREVYQALIARAGLQGLPVVGHMDRPYPFTGVASYEHSINTLRSDAGRDSLWRHFAASGAGFVPTLVVGAERLEPLDSLLAKMDPARNPLYRYIPASQIAEWRKEYEARRSETPFDWQTAHRDNLRNLREMKAMGIRFMAGADAATPFVIPGFGLHTELALLVELIGMMPVEALQAATNRPARFLGLADSLGTVETGKVADLVLLDANPLRDIRNTRRVSAVVSNGRLLNRKELDRLLAEVEAAAAKEVSALDQRRPALATLLGGMPYSAAKAVVK